MDAGQLFAQLDKADDELETVSGDLWKIFRDTYHLQHIFSDLAEKAAEIVDEDKRERFESVLSYLSDRLYEISEECYKVSGEIDTVREFDLSELFVEADEFSQSLLYLSDCFYEISQQNKKISSTFYKNKCSEIADNLAVQAENMAI